MKQQPLKIASVKLVNSGLKGIEVAYEKDSKKGSHVYRDEHKTKFKAPVYRDLLKAFESLKEHMSLICRLDSSDITKEAIEITGITSNGEDKFLIKAKIRTFDDAIFAVDTPLITEDTEYKGFHEVINIVNTIYDEVEFYIEGEKMAEEKQVVMDFAKQKSEEIDIEGLTDEEITAKYREYLEGTGAIVMTPDDYEDEVDNSEGEDTVVKVEETKTEETTEDAAVSKPVADAPADYEAVPTQPENVEQTPTAPVDEKSVQPVENQEIKTEVKEKAPIVMNVDENDNEWGDA